MELYVARISRFEVAVKARPEYEIFHAHWSPSAEKKRSRNFMCHIKVYFGSLKHILELWRIKKQLLFYLRKIKCFRTRLVYVSSYRKGCQDVLHFHCKSRLNEYNSISVQQMKFSFAEKCNARISNFIN